MKRTPRQQRAQLYALFRLTGIALWLGAVGIAYEATHEVTGIVTWAIGAAVIWPVRPDWRT